MKSLKERQKENNDRVFQRMKNPNDTLSVIDTSLTWMPPRPLIIKDKDAIAAIYGGENKVDK